MIYATLGTMHLDFARLIRAMDAVASETGERVVMQTGLANTVPRYCENFAFRPREELDALIRDARVVVSHAGIGSVIDVLNAHRPLIVVPRLKRFGEHNNDHQLDLARAVERRGWGRMVLDIEDLSEACAHPPAAYPAYRPAREQLIRTVRETIDAALTRG